MKAPGLTEVDMYPFAPALKPAILAALSRKQVKNGAQQNSPAARTTTTLGRVLGPTRQRSLRPAKRGLGCAGLARRFGQMRLHGSRINTRLMGFTPAGRTSGEFLRCAAIFDLHTTHEGIASQLVPAKFMPPKDWARRGFIVGAGML